MSNYNQNYFQDSYPVFVRKQAGITYNGKHYKIDKQFPWKEIDCPYETARQLFLSDQIYHNPELEKQNKVGDRLEELSGKDLKTFVDRVNAHVKAETNSADEYKKKKVKVSRVDEKQRGLIRSWLRNNAWAEDKYFEIRDNLLD